MMKRLSTLILTLSLLCLGACQPAPAPGVPEAVPSLEDGYPASSYPSMPEATPVGYPAPGVAERYRDDPLAVTSPDERILVRFELIEGIPTYQVDYLPEGCCQDSASAGSTAGAVPVILPARLGFDLKDAPPLGEKIETVYAEKRTFDETWEQPWGEQRLIRDHYNELRVTLVEAGDAPRTLVVVFRVFDDGVGFRYEVPAQPHLDGFVIMEERTEFIFSDNHTTWSIPAFQGNRYEYLITEETLRRIPRSVHTPFTLRTADGLHIVIHEAALIDYASMTLRPEDFYVMRAKLVPWANNDMVRTAAPMVSPWRTIQISPTAAGLITSYLTLNLNEPNRLADVSWVEPGKYIGIWWGMHIGALTWGSGPNHGATTERTMEYIDFAAQYGFRGVLVEGWNLGWDGNWANNGGLFKFTTPYPDFDIEAVTAYAAERGVRLIGHHETAAHIINYEAQLEDAFAYYQALGVDSVKTGYVGSKLVPNEWHHGQYGVRHYQKVIEAAARYGIMINAHEPIKDTGLRRTYPNFLTREGARGMEYDAWDREGGNPPDHVPKLVFQRMLSGPMDFTPGIFNLRFDDTPPYNQINTTLAKQLAYYVIIYSPLQMAADLPEHYLDDEGSPQPGFQFIVDVPADWEATVALNGEVGEYVTIARQDRNSRDWYLGAITNEEPRQLTVLLSFLEPGVHYNATIYADGAGAHWDTNPYPLAITEQTVNSTTMLTLDLAPGGGAAIRFTPAP